MSKSYQAVEGGGGGRRKKKRTLNSRVVVTQNTSVLPGGLVRDGPWCLL